MNGGVLASAAMVVSSGAGLVAMTRHRLHGWHGPSAERLRARARRLAMAALVMTLASLTLVEILVTTHVHHQSDLSRSWSWAYLVLGSLGPATATYWATVTRAMKPVAPDGGLVEVHATAVHAMIAARNAIELNQLDRADLLLSRATRRSALASTAGERR